MKPFDTNGAFAPSDPEGRTLHRLAVRGAGITVFSGAVGVAIQIVAAATLGRLLTPRDFGLVTMVTTVSLLLMNMAGNGFTDAVLQRKEINHQLASNLFWGNVVVGAVLALAFIAAGPVLAKFFGEAPVASIATGMSAAIFLTNASWVHVALAKRAMNFSSAALNEIVARAMGVSVSIFFGCLGWGYWSLVLGACTLALSTLVGAFVLCRWIPGRPRWTAGTREMFKFAMHVSGRYTLNYFASNTDNVLVGWRFGAHALGFYKKAYDLFALSASQLVSATSNVAVSTLRRVKDDRERYIRNLLAAIGVMAFVGMGIAGNLTLAGPDLIRILLGPGWDETGRIFVYFAPGIGMMMIYGTHGWIHVSIGRPDRWFLWTTVEWSVTILLFVAGLHFGPEGVAVAWCVSFWILAVPGLWYAGKPIGLGIAPVLSIVWRYVAASLLAILATSLMLHRFDALWRIRAFSGSVLRLATISVCFAVLYLGGVVLLHGGTSPLRKMTRLLREMMPSRTAGTPEDAILEKAVMQ